MKDDLRQVWCQEDKEAAAFVLDDWIKRAAACGIQMLQKFAKTLAAHRSGILACYDCDGLSAGPLEGTNNKIKTLQKMAYGFRDKAFLKFHYRTLFGERVAMLELNTYGSEFCTEVRCHEEFSTLPHLASRLKETLSS